MTIKDEMSPLDVWFAFGEYGVEWENFIGRPKLLGQISALRGFSPAPLLPYADIPWLYRTYLEGYLENCLPDYRAEALALYRAYGGYNESAYYTVTD
jgi:hypothetical protein